MSVQAMAWAMDTDMVQDHTARHVLLILANYADHQGRSAHPSVATVARQTGLSDRAVQMKVADLIECGALRKGNVAIVEANISRQDRRPNVYDLAMDGARGESHSPRMAERGENHAPREPATGCKPCTNGVQTVQERGEQFAPEPSKNHPEEPSIPPIVPQGPSAVVVAKPKKQPRAPGLSEAVTIPDWIPVEPWNRWVQHRQVKDGKKFTPGAMSLAVAKLLKLRESGEDIAEILDEAVLRNWSGLFPLNNGRGQNGSRPQRAMNRQDHIAHERFEELKNGRQYFDD